MLNKLSQSFSAAGTAGIRMISNMRGIEETIDEGFEAERKHYEAFIKHLEEMLSSLKKHTSNIDSMGQSLKAFSVCVARFSGDDQRVSGSEDFIKTADALIASSESYLKQAGDIQTNMKSLHDQLIAMKKDILERDKLLLTYDQARHDYAAVQAKSNAAAQALTSAQTKMETAKTNYESKSSAVMHQIAELYYTRTIHSDMQIFIASLSAFFLSASNMFAGLSKKMCEMKPPEKVDYRKSMAINHQQIQVSDPSPAPGQHPFSPSAAAPTVAAAAAAAPAHSPFHPPQQQQQPEATAKRVPPEGPPPAAPPAAGAPAPSQPQAAREMVEALFPFSPEAPTELGFVAGDKIAVVQRPHPDWWIGELNGKTGEFPSNYVKPINFNP